MIARGVGHIAVSATIGSKAVVVVEERVSADCSRLDSQDSHHNACQIRKATSLSDSIANPTPNQCVGGPVLHRLPSHDSRQYHSRMSTPFPFKIHH